MQDEKFKNNEMGIKRLIHLITVAVGLAQIVTIMKLSLLIHMPKS